MNNRLYSLFEKRGFRYHRITKQAYTLSTARIIFQDSLLAPALGADTPVRCLRTVDDGWVGNQRVYRPPVERETQGVDGVQSMAATYRSPSQFVRSKLAKTEGPRKPEIVEPEDGPWRSGGRK